MPTKISWCDETVNPLGHGCYGPGGTAEKPKRCSYCYAYKLAKRNMRGCDLCKQFIPHTHFEQLAKLQEWKKPKKIFVQSMGDLFHDAVPDEWIEQVFNACEKAPWHQYLFLTKNPKRYDDLFLPPRKNFWYGTTLESQDIYETRGRELKPIPKLNYFLSLEPLLSEINFHPYTLKVINWVIIGQQTNPTIVPKDEWVQSIIDECHKNDVPVFIKEPLYKRFPIQEYPIGLGGTP